MKYSFNPNVCSGLLFLAVALLFGVKSLDYRIGTMAAIGAGFFPLALSVLLGIMGLGLVLSGVRIRELATEATSPRALIVVLGSVLLFAVSLGRLGLIGAIVLLSVTASLAHPRFTLRSAVGGALFVAALSYLIFKVLLNLPVRFWPGF